MFVPRWQSCIHPSRTVYQSTPVKWGQRLPPLADQLKWAIARSHVVFRSILISAGETDFKGATTTITTVDQLDQGTALIETMSVYIY